MDLDCNKGHKAKSYPEFRRSHVVLLANHFCQFFLQVLLGCVLDINVVALGASEVAAYALCEETEHHSPPHQL